ncbi:glycine cleavage system H-protein, partial [Kipferlia bialata]|eukprot:g11968.t1
MLALNKSLAPLGRAFGTMFYTPSHEYVNVEAGIATVGITNYAAHHLGELVYVDMPEVGDAFDQ